MSAMPPDLEQYIEHLLSIGEYTSREALLIDAIRLHRRVQLQADIQLGIDELDQGLGEPFDIEEIKRDLCERVDEHGRPRQRQE